MRLLHVRTDLSDGWATLTGTVRRGDQEFDLWFRYPEWCFPFLRPLADPFLAAMSVPAAVAGEPLGSDLPASPSLLRGLIRATDVLRTWHPEDLGPLELDVPLRTEPVAPGPEVAAAFFSGGVDSFDTALQNLWHPAPGNPPLKYTLFIHGLETELHREQGAEEAEQHASTVARTLGLTPIVGWTNIRSHFPLDYGTLYCGVALAATALSLAGGYRVLLLPSSMWNASVHGWGHHILIDEPCSTEYLRLENDGGDVSRTHKVIRSIAQSEVALANLRSCSRNNGALQNCGTCPKCVRTMMALEIAGALRRSETFPRQLPPDWINIMLPRRPEHIIPNIEATLEIGASLWLVPVLWRRARRVVQLSAIRDYLEVSPFKGQLESWRARKRARAARLGGDQ